jgi:hypothetical protein
MDLNSFASFAPLRENRFSGLSRKAAKGTGEADASQKPGGDMNAEDMKKIEAMLSHHVGALAEKIEAATESFKTHVGVLTEDFQHKLDLVVEGHEVLHQEIREIRDESNAKHEQTAFLLRALNDKVDGVENRLSAKIDAVAGDLAAHRKDTEAHGAVWRVKEEGE